jgi:hypothetical protein
MRCHRRKILVGVNLSTLLFDAAGTLIDDLAASRVARFFRAVVVSIVRRRNTADTFERLVPAARIDNSATNTIAADTNYIAVCV